MVSLGQQLDDDTQLICGRCGHMTIVSAGSIVKPCPTCMSIEFELATHEADPTVPQAAAIGCVFDELKEFTGEILRSKSGLNRMQIDAISEAVAHAIGENNRKLQEDIDIAFQELLD